MSSSSSSSSRSTSPEPQVNKKLKRKRKEAVKEVEEEAAEVDGNSNESSTGDSGDKAERKEVPVLSHAEQRRQKKQAKLAAQEKELEGSAVKKRKLKDGTAKVVESSSTTKRQHSVWVGNMSFKTQQENLRTFFKDVGEITRVNMPTKPPAGPGVKPENRGFAYVDFATAEAKTAAIALSEQPLLGRKLLIKDGGDFAGRPAAIGGGEHTISDPALAHKTHSKTAQKILRVQKQPPAPTLFFGNLGYETTDASIRELLEAHRHSNKKDKDTAQEAEQKTKDVWIRKVRMGTFEDTGACKGFAFVDFMTIDDATSALINPKNHHLNGRNLVVEYAGPDAVRRGAPKGKGGGDGVFKGKRAARPDRTNWNSERPPRNSEDQEHGVDEAAAVDATPAAEERPKRPWEHKERSFSSNDGARHKGPKSRPKPGAALALAKRESTSIVPSEGRKITF